MRSLSLPSLRRLVAKRETKVERFQADLAESPEEVCVGPTRQPRISLSAKESSEASSSPRSSPPVSPASLRSSEASTAASSSEAATAGARRPPAAGRRVARRARPGLRRTPTEELLDGYPELCEEGATAPLEAAPSLAAVARSSSTPRLPHAEATQRSSHDLQHADRWAVSPGAHEERRVKQQRRPQRRVFAEKDSDRTLYNRSPASVQQLYKRGMVAHQAAKLVATARAREMEADVTVDLESLPALIKRTSVLERNLE